MTLEDRVERLENIVETQTDLLESIVNLLNNDNRLKHITKALEQQREINDLLFEMVKKS